MEAVRALADLVEISPQIEAAAVLTAGGELAGSIGVPEARASILAQGVRQLLEGAASYRGGERRLTQLQADLADGDLFAVTDTDEGTIVAVTGGGVPAGLVFYDLKRCLVAVADEP